MAVSLRGQLQSFGIFTSSSESLFTFTCIWARGNFHKGRVRYIYCGGLTESTLMVASFLQSMLVSNFVTNLCLK
ncbi:hypothetical protein ACB092_09G046900 [Castanea dentata]